jgi:hypothetical protein
VGGVEGVVTVDPVGLGKTGSTKSQSSGLPGMVAPVAGLTKEHGAEVDVVGALDVVVVGSGAVVVPLRVVDVVGAEVVVVALVVEVTVAGGSHSSSVVVVEATVVEVVDVLEVVVDGAVVVVVEIEVDVAGANQSSSPSAFATGPGDSATAPQITPVTATTTQAARLSRRARRTNSFKPSTLRPERTGPAGNVTGGVGDPPSGRFFG